MAAHDRLDSLSGLVSVIEGDGADVVVQDVCFDDAVEEVWANGPEVAVNGRCGTASEGPGLGGVMRERGVSVLEEGDCDCEILERFTEGGHNRGAETYQASD